MNAWYVLTILVAIGPCAWGLRWEEAAPMPTPRMDAASAVVGDTLYVMGGRRRGGGSANETNQGIQDVVEGYVVAENRWVTGLPPLPAPVADMACATAGGRIYLLGGTGGGNALSNAVWSWAPGEPAWYVHSDTLPGGVRGAAACSPDGLAVLIVGGSDAAGSFLGSVYRFTPESGFSSLPPVLQARSGACAGVVGGEPIVVGGYFHGPLSSTEMLSPGGWSEGPPLPDARGSSAACQGDGLLFVLGGQGATGPLNQVVILSSAGGQWLAMEPMLQDRARLAGGVVGGYLVAAGGTGHVGYEATGSCERASLATTTPPDFGGRPSPALRLSAWPNPFSHHVKLTADVGSSVPWAVSIYHQDGRQVCRWEGCSATLCVRLLDGEELPCGAYVVMLESGSHRVSLPIMRVR